MNIKSVLVCLFLLLAQPVMAQTPPGMVRIVACGGMVTITLEPNQMLYITGPRNYIHISRIGNSDYNYYFTAYEHHTLPNGILGQPCFGRMS